jgi:protoheme IX farnesyltransferase
MVGTGAFLNARAVSVASTASDLVSLTKPRLSSLVLVTAAGGMFLAPGRLTGVQALTALLSTAGIVGAANALNCFLERDSDRYMRRTARRPLPSGRMEPAVALWFGISLAAFSLPALWISSNAVTAGLGLLALLSYVLAYTPLKAKSVWAMWVGAVPGALPPLMGWTSVTGEISRPGFSLFAILFLWQLPHFLAIALFRQDEYRAAGLKSVPTEQGEAASRMQLAVLSLLLWPVTLLPLAYGMAGQLYGATAAVLGAGFTGYAVWGWWKRADAVWARRVFFLSLIYLTVLFGVLCLDVVR